MIRRDLISCLRCLAIISCLAAVAITDEEGITLNATFTQEDTQEITTQEVTTEINQEVIQEITEDAVQQIAQNITENTQQPEPSPPANLQCVLVTDNPSAPVANDDVSPAEEPTTISTEPESLKSCPCGISRSGRVVGGTEVKPHEFPWLVALTVDGYFTCGGSLITERHVLTAAHCVSGTSRRKMKVIIGLHHVKEYPTGRKTYSVDYATYHYLYWNGMLGIHNDIAILELNDTVKFSPTVRPICLPNGDEVYKDKMLTVAGWGHTSETGRYISQVPLKAEIKVLGNKYCRRNYWNLIFAIHICAGTEQGGKDSCQGDSGGPLMLKESGRWVQAGVVSYGKGCARKSYPGLYTRVNQYLSWIERNTRSAKLCRKER